MSDRKFELERASAALGVTRIDILTAIALIRLKMITKARPDVEITCRTVADAIEQAGGEATPGEKIEVFVKLCKEWGVLVVGPARFRPQGLKPEIGFRTPVE
jgi:hypothetical protein